MRVLMNAGPWLAVPPPGYGGIENVVATLVSELRARGVEVVLASVAESKLEADGRVHVFERGQFRHLAGPYPQIVGIAHAHMHVVTQAARDGGFDLVHDHLEVVGPSLLAAAGADSPPALETLHWNLRKHPDFYGRFDGRGRVFFNGVSRSQLERAPRSLQRQALAAIPLGVRVEDFPYRAEKDADLLVLGRFTHDKGPDIAACACRQLDLPLELAGPVAGMADAGELAQELANPSSPLHRARDVEFFRECVEPELGEPLVRWVGTLTGDRKLERLARARAALFPIRWAEPGGTAVVEALACGTPVVAMRRGCMPELVDHGVTGFLAADEEEFAGYLGRVDELDPAACRRAAEERFSASLMAERYLKAYADVLARCG